MSERWQPAWKNRRSGAIHLGTWKGRPDPSVWEPIDVKIRPRVEDSNDE